MSESAFITVYREEYVPAFERGMTNLRMSCTTEAAIDGKTAVFLVAGSGNATATTRGTNGLIPSRNNSNTQLSCTLSELNDLVDGTAFTWDLSQGDQRRIAAESSAKVIYRSMDSQIIAQLDTATINDSASTASLAKVTTALAALGNANVDIQEADNMFGLITPAFMAGLMQLPEFSSADYVDIKPFSGPARKYLRWSGVNWMVHPGLTGVGTSSEKCYLYHRNSIGHAFSGSGIDVAAGKDEKQNQYWTRTSVWAQAKLLQNSGVVQMLHDGSATALS